MSWWRWEPKVSGVMSGALLRHKLSKMCPDAEVIITDREYQIPANPDDVIWKVSPSNLLYNPETRDCDDFVRMARGWLSRKNFGNLLVMDCAIELSDGSRHAFLENTKIIFGEPQTGNLINYSHPVKIYRLIA